MEAEVLYVHNFSVVLIHILHTVLRFKVFVSVAVMATGLLCTERGHVTMINDPQGWLGLERLLLACLFSTPSTQQPGPALHVTRKEVVTGPLHSPAGYTSNYTCQS